MQSFRTAVVLVLFIAAFSCASVVAGEKVNFNRQIRAILSDNCYQCHGPDENSREADLRLDQEAGANADEIVARITSNDPDFVMPPPETKKRLNAEQKNLIVRWIEQGAQYDKHWSFLPIVDYQPPKVRNVNGVRNLVDQFILARLEPMKIEPSPQADPNTLIKRLYIDLTGVLPSPDETRKYTAMFRNGDQAAINQLVDDLLDSPHYAERWARHWLDQARYADSNGYTIDGDRVMWPYRDWVIRAIRDDMPFDQFTIDQIAGDLLPSATKMQLVATGFHRNTLINQEGGTDPEQFRNEAVVDRVNTTGAVWLGLTIGCAQCHSHKFDPISQREFYQLFAFFNHGQDKNNTGPTVEVAENELLIETDPDKITELNSAKADVANLEATKGKRQLAWEKQQIEKLQSRTVADWKPLEAVSMEAAGGAKLTVLDDGSILAGKGAASETYSVTYQSELDSIAALRFRVMPHNSLPKNGPGLAANGNFVLTGLELWHGDKQIPIERAVASHAQPRFPFTNAIDGKSSTGWAINIGKGTAAGKKMNAEHDARLILASPISVGDRPLKVVLRHEGNGKFYNVGRFAFEASATAPSLDMDESLLKALTSKKRSKAQMDLLAKAFVDGDVELKAAQSRVAQARRAAGLGKTARSMIMRELTTQRETYIHIRGDFLRKDKNTGLLAPGVPGVLPQLPGENESQLTRLDLARWLVNKNNPLTARVTVNRVWMRFFGRGLVETENDFGSQGTPPTHPMLLDWLASSFMNNGWSMKRLHKLIVTSATYRQSSHYRRDLLERDARNLLLARQNRLRYDAEIVRDAALSASGMLNARVGGPSVRPPQPAGVYAFTQTNKNWVDDNGPNRFRRAMYTRFYRSAPYPMLTTFDAPDFQSVCTRRPRSNTPLQSLTMANDKVFFELAQGMATHIMTETKGSTDHDRINRAFMRCYCRPATDTEITAVANYFQIQSDHFTSDSKAAGLIAPQKIPAGFSKAQAAAWTTVARALMNTDEFITRE